MLINSGTANLSCYIYYLNSNIWNYTLQQKSLRDAVQKKKQDIS